MTEGNPVPISEYTVKFAGPRSAEVLVRSTSPLEPKPNSLRDRLIYGSWHRVADFDFLEDAHRFVDAVVAVDPKYRKV